MFLLHGTTIAAACNIIIDGFQTVDTISTCSDPCSTYMVEVGNKYTEAEAISFACEMAQIASAKLGVYDTDIAIFGFNIPDEITDIYLLPDISCKNMDDCWCIDNERLNELILNGSISCSPKVIPDAYIPYLRPFYLIHTAYQTLMSLDKTLKNVCDNLQRTDNMDLYDIIFPADAYTFHELCNLV